MRATSPDRFSPGESGRPSAPERLLRITVCPKQLD
jgi:hypothetical protein